MLHLPPNSTKILKAKIEFREGMVAFAKGRINKIHKIKKGNVSTIKSFFDQNVKNCIEDILMGEPSRLQAINSQLAPQIKLSKDIEMGIRYVFNYDLFITKASKRYDAYKLAESLAINTCTYCNRNYTSTVISRDGKKLVRPQFDHYFDRAENPLLAISFFNLIPSCSVCNADIKGTAKFNLNEYLHPYLDDSIDEIRFTYKYSSQTKSGLKIEVVTLNPPKAKNTMEAFAIEQVYNSHTGELLDLLKARQYFSDKYLSILGSNLLKHVIVSREELYRIVFGAEYDSANFVNRPLSKFKSDILKELGVK